MKYTKEQIEAQIVMKAGNLKQDLITAQEIVKDAGLDMTSPIAPITMNFVLAEIRKIRVEFENPFEDNPCFRA